MDGDNYPPSEEILNRVRELSDESKYELLCGLLNNKPYDISFIEAIIPLITDTKYLLEFLKIIPITFSSDVVIQIFEQMKNDDERLEGITIYFNHANRLFLLKQVLITLESDRYKQAFFYMLSDREKVDIIKSFKSDEEKIKYIDNYKYSDYKAELVASLTKKQKIADYFNRSSDIRFNLELIKQINDPKLKLLFINGLGFKDLSKFWEEIHTEYESNENNYALDKIDPNITIGIELEVCHKYIDLFKLENKIFEDYTITEDESLDNNGFEIKSPILHYTNEDLSKLKRVCDILNDTHFYTDKNCGGHIHIGADYLSNIENFKTLLYIYCNCENIFYLISNKSNTKFNKRTKQYATKIKNLYIKSLKKDLLPKGEQSFENFIKILVKINGQRNKGMNLYNLGDVFKNTIEFRIPNGEINFDELRNNIKLFAKLVEKSKELSSPEISEKDKALLTALNIPCTDDDKLEILLGLLFESDEEKQVYRDRYNTNKNTKQRVMSKYYKDNKILHFN